MPAHRPGDELRVRVHDQLVWVEAVSRMRRIRSMYAIAVQLPGADVRQVAVPDHVRLLRKRDGERLDLSIHRVEQAQLHARRVFREDGEVDADAVPGGAERVRPAGPDAEMVRGHDPLA